MNCYKCKNELICLCDEISEINITDFIVDSINSINFHQYSINSINFHQYLIDENENKKKEIDKYISFMNNFVEEEAKIRKENNKLGDYL
jgi:D-mannonate dehydratase